MAERVKKGKDGIDVLPYTGRKTYPSLYLMTQKPTAYAINSGTLSRYEYYKSRSDQGGYRWFETPRTVITRLKAPCEPWSQLKGRE